MKDKIYDILMVDDVVLSINNNLVTLLELIPEIKDMIGFSHNHPHHHLDVWNHTLLALSLADFDFDTRLVLLLHDIGKPHSYQDDEVRHFRGHADVSSLMASVILKRLGFSEDEVRLFTYLIKEHDTEISYEEIKSNYDLSLKKFKVQICDALAHNPLKLEKRIKYLERKSKEMGNEDDVSLKIRLVKN